MARMPGPTWIERRIDRSRDGVEPAQARALVMLHRVPPDIEDLDAGTAVLLEDDHPGSALRGPDAGTQARGSRSQNGDIKFPLPAQNPRLSDRTMLPVHQGDDTRGREIPAATALLHDREVIVAAKSKYSGFSSRGRSL